MIEMLTQIRIHKECFIVFATRKGRLCQQNNTLVFVELGQPEPSFLDGKIYDKAKPTKSAILPVRA